MGGELYDLAPLARVLLTGKGREMRISIVPSNTGNPAPHNWPEVGH